LARGATPEEARTRVSQRLAQESGQLTVDGHEEQLLGTRDAEQLVQVFENVLKHFILGETLLGLALGMRAEVPKQ
jgi:hypothetical protein